MTQEQEQHQDVQVEGQPETQTVDTGDRGFGIDLEGAHKAAEEFLAEQNREREEASAPVRDDKGRFVAQKKEEAQPTEQPQETSQPTIDPVWVERAKQEGFAPEKIAQFSSDQELQNAIALNRIQTMQRLGIDPMELAAYQEWRKNKNGQNGAPQQTNAAPHQPQQDNSVANELEALNLNINEEELDASVTTPIKATAEYVNKVKAYVDAKFDEFRKEREQEAQQRVELENRTKAQQQLGQMFDSAADKVQGLKEVLGGTPTELSRLAEQNPNDPKVRKFLAWDMAYFQPAFEKFQSVLGFTPQAIELAFKKALEDSGGFFGKPAPVNNGQPVKNGVMKASNRSTSMKPSDGGTLQDEYSRASTVVGDIWDQFGGNPFATG